jgi:hypothetical protein
MEISNPNGQTDTRMRTVTSVGIAGMLTSFTVPELITINLTDLETILQICVQIIIGIATISGIVKVQKSKTRRGKRDSEGS